MLVYPLAGIDLDRSAEIPLYLQLYNSLRQAILSGRLRSETRLPPTRDLARSLSVSRNTVLDAYDQLMAEGYLETRPRSGVWVTCDLPDTYDIAEKVPTSPRPTPDAQSPRPLSARGETLRALHVNVPSEPFAHRAFAIAAEQKAFPFGLWSRLVNLQYREGLPRRFALPGIPDPRGYAPLRKAIAEYLRVARSVDCHPDQVFITSGSALALYLVTQILVNPGDGVCFEEPGSLDARKIFLGAGARLIPIPVQADGLDVASVMEQAGDARLVYSTPSCQFPLGHTLSVSKRLKLLEWAHQTGTWVIEDDYDSLYRFVGHPLAAMQGLDRNHRVIYMGALNKVLFPALGMGYLIAPPDLVEAFIAVRKQLNSQPALVDQAALAEFIQAGHFARHIRHTRKLYAQRRDRLVSALRHAIGDWVRIEAPDSGMHLLAWLPPGDKKSNVGFRAPSGMSETISDLDMFFTAAKHEVGIAPLSAHYLGAQRQHALMLGFAPVDEAAIDSGVERLRQALDEVRHQS